MKVVQIFRKKNLHFFSIENVFNHVRNAWNSYYIPEVISLPELGFSILNLIYVFNERTKRKDSIFHVTGDVHYIVMALPRKRTILTIHDCVFLSQNTGIKRWVLKKILLDFPVRYVRYITAISEKTKQEIVENTGCNPEKIVVIPNPVSPLIYFQQKKFNEKCPACLFIGITPNKNFERVCIAIRDIESILLILGRLSEDMIYILNKYGIKYKVFHDLSDGSVADLYAESDIIIFPSLYEGFGLPIIEGFKAGRVVITSNLNPMKSIASEAACLVDPLSIQSIRDGMIKVINDESFRYKLIENGFDVVKKYQPETIALQYDQLYQRVSRESCVA